MLSYQAFVSIYISNLTFQISLLEASGAMEQRSETNYSEVQHDGSVSVRPHCFRKQMTIMVEELQVQSYSQMIQIRQE